MKISVIIPSHNRLLDLKKAVESVFNQSILPFELIVIDDGSTEAVEYSIFDNAPDGLKCLLLTNEVPLGGNNARNKGVLEASGGYIAFLDDDDEFFRDKIKIISEFISKNHEVDLFYHKAEIHMVKEGYVYFSRPTAYESSDDAFKNLLIKNWVGGTPMVIVKKKSLIEVGGFDEQMPALQDYELWLRMAKLNMKFMLVNEPLTKYNYVTKKQTVSKSVKVNQHAVSLIEKKFEEDYKNLSKKDYRKYRQWQYKNTIHRSILNGQIGLAFKCQFEQLYKYPSFWNFFKFFAILLGPQFIYKLKSKGF
jgi:glycosyltransferase involved in cell wall biosynthesis